MSEMLFFGYKFIKLILPSNQKMIEHPSEPKLNPYSEINPYYLIYCNMNIKITDEISKQSAENVVRQIGYLHNAMGHVFKDLVKILSFKFPNHVSTPTSNPPPSARPTPSPKPTHPQRYSQPMDLENEVIETAPKPKNRSKPQIEERINIQDYGRKNPIQIVQQFNQQQQKPPNTNIFDEYAYSMQPIDTKPKEVPSIRLTLSKGSEGAIKKKKENKPTWNLNQGKQQRPLQHKKQRKQTQKKPTPLLQTNLRLSSEKDAEERQEFDMFKQFMYQEGEQILPKPQPLRQQSGAQDQVVKSALQNNEKEQEEQPNQQIWGFLKNRQQPQVFQISDDEQG